MVLSPWHKRAFRRMYCRNIRPRVLALAHNCLVGEVDEGREVHSAVGIGLAAAWGTDRWQGERAVNGCGYGSEVGDS